MLTWFGISYEIELGKVWGLGASQHKCGVTEALHHRGLRDAKPLTPQLLPFEGSRIWDILSLSSLLSWLTVFSELSLYPKT